MFKESFFFGWIFRLYAVLSRYFSQSLIISCFIRIKNAIVSAFKNSSIFQFLFKDGFAEKSWDKSAFYFLIDNTLNLIPKIFGVINKKLKNILETSIFYKIIQLFSERLFLYSGLLVGFIFIVPHDYWNNLYSLLIFIALLFLFFVCAVTGRFDGFKLKELGFYTFLFLLFVGFSFIFSKDISRSVRFLLFYITAFLAMALPVSIIKTKGEFLGFLAPVLVGMTVGGLYGVYQSIVGVPLKSWQVDLVQNEGIPGRIYSLYENPNNFAELIVLIFPFFIAVFMYTKNIYVKLLSLGCAATLAVSMVFTMSRSGWIGLALCLFLFMLFIAPRLLPFLLVLGLVIIPFLPTWVYRRILTIFISNDTSSQYRFAIIGTMWPIVSERWFSGYGLGNDVLYDYANIYFKVIHTTSAMLTKSVPIHCHNIFMQIWAEMGILGLFSFLAFIASFLKRSLKAITSNLFENDLKPFVAAGFGAIIGTLAIGFVEYVWFYPRNMVMFFLIMGITLTAVKIGKKPTVI